MFVSNLTNRNLGLASPVVLRPNEVNRYIDPEDTRLVESVWRAKAANLVSVSETEGLIKTITATAVKTLTFDAGAMDDKPRSSGKHAEEVEKVLKERITKEKKKAVKDEVTKAESNDEVATVVASEAQADETKVESKSDEAVVESKSESKSKKAKNNKE